MSWTHWWVIKKKDWRHFIWKMYSGEIHPSPQGPCEWLMTYRVQVPCTKLKAWRFPCITPSLRRRMRRGTKGPLSLSFSFLFKFREGWGGCGEVQNRVALRSSGKTVNAGGVCVQGSKGREGFSPGAEADVLSGSPSPHLWPSWPSESFLGDTSGLWPILWEMPTQTDVFCDSHAVELPLGLLFQESATLKICPGLALVLPTFVS